MTDVVTGALQVDIKRRTTLPGNILVAAGIPPGSTLVARVEEPGRIVLESPQLLLALLQDDIAAALNPDADADADSELMASGLAVLDEPAAEGGADTTPEQPGALGSGAAGAEEPAPAGAADKEGRA